jgi:HlyD family secretion protein
MKRTLIAISILVLIATAIVGALLLAPGEEVVVVAAQRGDVRRFIDEKGVTRLRERHLISTPYAGRTEGVTLPVGTLVAPAPAGPVIAEMSEEDLDLEVAALQAVVETLDAQIAENDDVTVESTAKRQAEKFVDATQSVTASAKAQTEASQARADYAESFLRRVESVAGTGGATQDELQRARMQSVEAKAAYRTDVFTQESVEAIQTAVTLLPELIAQYIDRKKLSRTTLEKQKAEAVARLEESLLRRRRRAIYSPVEGVLLKRTVVSPQALAAGAELAEVGSIEDLRVEADLLSDDAVELRAGQPAEIYGPAVGREAGNGLPGTVELVEPEGFEEVSSLGVEEQRVRVAIELPEETRETLVRDRKVGVEYAVRVRIEVEAATDAIYIPRTALYRAADGGRRVFVVDDGRLLERAVRTGILTDEAAQIVEGLAEGELVALAPENSYRDGMKATAVEP